MRGKTAAVSKRVLAFRERTREGFGYSAAKASSATSGQWSE